MILKTRGKPLNIDQPIIGKVTRDPYDNADSIYLDDGGSFSPNRGFKSILSVHDEGVEGVIKQVYAIPSLSHLENDDIVVINTDGVVNTLFRAKSHHNFLLFTERCNSNCLMCSQPPKDRDDTDYFYHLYSQLIPIIPKDCLELGITGGEPTLMGDRFFSLLELLKTQLPETEIHCLTNGRAFAWSAFAESLGRLQYNRLMLGVPLYSDAYYIHDYIVQSRDAFNQTMEGLYNLATHEQRIEIRIVLHLQTIPRLVKLAKYIYKNLPFVEHVAFMGLEHQGYTPFNIDKLWIDPVQYQDELREAVAILDGFGMNVSIYNAQLCTLPKDLWKYARKSISDWKNVYLQECKACSVLEQCGGLFESGLKKHSQFIRTI